MQKRSANVRQALVDGWDLDAALPEVERAAGTPGATAMLPPAIPLREPFPLTHVRLLPDGGMHHAAHTKNAQYLLKTLEPHRLLAAFRITAKLQRKASPYCDAGTPAGRCTSSPSQRALEPLHP